VPLVDSKKLYFDMPILSQKILVIFLTDDRASRCYLIIKKISYISYIASAASLMDHNKLVNLCLTVIQAQQALFNLPMKM
jgi:hypothetical protein